MIASLKAEFLKLFTVRSTYIIVGLAFLLEMFFAFYATGWRAMPTQLAEPHYLMSQVTSALNVLMLLAAIVAILLITHEYRYNTIMHTLTSNTSRTKVLLSKLLALSCFAIVFALVFGFLSPALTILAVKLHGHSLSHQIFTWGNILWRTMFYGWGVVMLAAILAFIVRIQVGALVAFFIIPSTVENIAGILLKKNQVYLPFSALNTLVDTFPGENHISYIRGATIALIYIIVGWIIAWILFLRRDAN
jgi:ABC-2 type transport system permease protein